MTPAASHLSPKVSIIDRRAAYNEKLRRTGASRELQHSDRAAKGQRVKAAVAERAAGARERQLARAVSRLDFTAVLARQP